MEPNKWSLPGWRIEQRYNNNVLIGNWNEENRRFQTGNAKSNSTHRTDFSRYTNFMPDNKSRQSTLLKNEGLDKALIFSQSGASQNYSNNLISWYDQDYNGRQPTQSKLPALRSWDGRSLAWAPERSDHPLQASPTNFGLLEKKLRKQNSTKNELGGDYVTTYGSSYKELPKDFLVTRHHSSPKSLSSHFNQNNKLNKDLDFRDVRVHTSQEHPPNKLLLSV
eukprot:gene14942-16483_t